MCIRVQHKSGSRVYPGPATSRVPSMPATRVSPRQGPIALMAIAIAMMQDECHVGWQYLRVSLQGARSTRKRFESPTLMIKSEQKVAIAPAKLMETRMFVFPNVVGVLFTKPESQQIVDASEEGPFCPADAACLMRTGATSVSCVVQGCFRLRTLTTLGP